MLKVVDVLGSVLAWAIQQKPVMTETIWNAANMSWS